MARIYIDFRIYYKLDNNSLRDILTKQKYDIKTLQFVVRQIGRGINLLKVDQTKYQTILDDLTALTPNDADSDSRKDLSYYFYMGYFRGKKQ